MKPFGTIDLETDPFQRRNPLERGREPQAFSGALFDGQRTGVSWSRDCCRYIVRECSNKQYTGWLFYAHNGGKFDFHFLLAEILQLYSSDEIELMCIGSRIVKIKTPVCEFRDSFCIIPKRLKDIVHANKKDIEIWKLEESFKDLTEEQQKVMCSDWINPEVSPGFLRIGHPVNVSPRLFYKEEITAYLKQDCHGLHSALTLFFERYGQEITLASTCFKVLKKQFELPELKTNERFDSKFRQFYFAGRVQFFGLGKFGSIDGIKRYSICDINSAFPWAMLSHHWYTGDYITVERPPKNNREQCFYEITCDSDGILPLRQKTGGVSFPTVERTKFFATGWEYYCGLELGKIRNVKIHAVHVPLALRSFENYINHFYKLKLEADKAGNQAERDFNKLFMNGAYGKFCLNCREFRDVKITEYGEIPEPIEIKHKNNTTTLVHWEHSYDDLDRCLSFWQMPSHSVSKRPMLFNCVATGASITGCVRAFLARSMASCYNVLYCDTDSIIAGDTSRLVMGDSLGQWKLEKECDALWIGGKKLYAAHDFRGAPNKEKGDKFKEWKTASKGVRLTAEEICAVAEGEEKTYAFEAPNYSIFSGTSFTRRTVRRDDLRNKR